MREKGVSEKYVRLIMEMYVGATTKVRSSMGLTEGFSVKVGLHQESTLSPFLFNIIMDVITNNIKRSALWNMLFADDVVLCDENKEHLEVTLKK